MSNRVPLVNKKYLLEKFPGKGGWTYALIPEVLQNRSTPFGWVKVNGKIDEYELKHYKLMPMGNGKLFLPVKAEIRKKIGKREGDYVKVILYADESQLEIPDEILDCFEQESKTLLRIFMNFTESEQKAYLDWIYKAKKEDTKVTRIVSMMAKISKGLRFHEKESD
jgi:hypothetical protein